MSGDAHYGASWDQLSDDTVRSSLISAQSHRILDCTRFVQCPHRHSQSLKVSEDSPMKMHTICGGSTEVVMHWLNEKQDIMDKLGKRGVCIDDSDGVDIYLQDKLKPSMGR